MFSFLITDIIDIEPPKITKYHYEITLNSKNSDIEEYELWSDKELDYISKVDLSTSLEDDEDYSKW